MFYVPTVLVGYFFGVFSTILFIFLKNVIKNFFLVDYDPFPGIKGLTNALRLPDSEILENPKINIYGELTVHEGWMVVYFDHYNSETFEIDQAKPAYINLLGSTLRISYPKQRVLRKARWDEKEYKKEFTHFHEFDIFNCRVKLLPEDLKSNKRWSRRFPIYIAITDSSSDLFNGNDSLSLPNSETNQDSETMLNETHRSTVRSVAYRLTATESPSKETPLYLFGRTDRQKEDWFRRLLAASKTRYVPPVPNDNLPSSQSGKGSQGDKSDTSKGNAARQRFVKYLFPFHLEATPSQYLHFLSDYQLQVLTDSGIFILKPLVVSDDGVKSGVQVEIERARKSKISPNLLWFNVFLGRILNDLTKNPNVLARIHHIIQKKMYRMGLPSFIEDIRVKELKLGENVPRIHCASNPMLDERGIWANIEVSYIGDATVVFETKLNLIDLKPSKDEEIDDLHAGMRTRKTTVGVHNLSDGEDAYGEQSEDQFSSHTIPHSSQPSCQQTSLPERQSVPEEEPIKRRKVKSRFLRCVNQVVRSKMFQCVTRHSCFKSVAEQWSNTAFTLIAVLKGFSGTLTINIPPPPSDRIFLGFHNRPYLHLTASPEMGQINVQKRAIVGYIEKTILKHLTKKLTLPNMINIVIPRMNGNIPE